MATLLISIALFSCTVLLRALPRLFLNKGKLFLFTNDTWFHLMLAEEIRQNNHSIPGKISRFLLSESLTYPALFHILLSYVNKTQRTAIEPYLGGLFDGIVSVCLFLAARFFLTLDLQTSFFIVCLFIFSPYTLGLNFGPRATLGTPRVFGQLLFFLAVLLTIQYVLTGSFYSIVAAIWAGSLLFSASMFSSQAYVFILLLWSILLPSLCPLVVLVSSYLLALLLSRGYVWHITKGHIQHLVVMARAFWRGRFSDQNIQQRNRLDELLNLPRYLFTDLKQLFFLFYVRNTFLILLFQIPVMSLYIYYRLVDARAFPTLPLTHALDTLFIAGLLIFIAVSTKMLSFLGEAERYIEHVSPFCCLFIGLMMPVMTSRAVTLLLIYSISLYLINGVIFVYLIKNKESEQREQHIRSVLDWIDQNAHKKRFAVLPHTNLNVLIPYFTTGFVLFGRWKNDSSPAVKSLKDVESTAFRQHRVSLLQTYAIDYIVISAKAGVHPNLEELKREFRTVFENPVYSVLSCQKQEHISN
ncbi:hypothetical protein [Spirosoma fluviale]|uniref:Uncharacterized protein n=1 Tax=Spirosoma fluviale TaxID=1597977 RepID=A0A286FEK7_9BACT|nr:hypothetical protein [Spirosoma fluviale]SOD81661.1 hypothetical protein SAMN06269250_1867 [Spirosoma fluviale]